MTRLLTILAWLLASVLVVGGLVSCKKFGPPCFEKVCRPGFFDCDCYTGARIERLPNGDIACRCDK